MVAIISMVVTGTFEGDHHCHIGVAIVTLEEVIDTTDSMLHSIWATIILVTMTIGLMVTALTTSPLYNFPSYYFPQTIVVPSAPLVYVQREEVKSTQL